jgi:hypothetical protein
LAHSAGGIPQYGGLPNAGIKDLKVREIDGVRIMDELSGERIAVLDVNSAMWESNRMR